MRDKKLSGRAVRLAAAGVLSLGVLAGGGVVAGGSPDVAPSSANVTKVAAPATVMVEAVIQGDFGWG